MSVFNKEFSTGEVVAATGVPNETLQSWLKRDLIVGHKGGGSQGRHRKFSYFNLIEIGMAKALIDAGMGGRADLATIINAATNFAHNGSYKPEAPQREVGVPYPEGKTLVLAGVGWSDAICLKPDESALALFAAMRGEQRHLAAVVIDASEVFERIISGAGMNPREVMAEAYAKAGEN